MSQSTQVNVVEANAFHQSVRIAKTVQSGSGPEASRPTPRHGRPTKSDFDWLRDHLNRLSEWGDRAHSVEPGVFHDYGLHTGLKLAALKHATEVFATVAGSYAHRLGFGPTIYLDLFAGCGLNRLPEGDWLAGSPIIALNAPKPFEGIICIEADPRRASALKSRINLWDSTRVTVVEGDCNQQVAKISETIGPPRPLVFAVVDQEKMDVTMATLSGLSMKFEYIDYAITHPKGAQRELEAAVAQGRDSPKIAALTGLGLDEILDSNTGDVREAFSKQVQTVLGKQIGRASLVRDELARPLYFVLTFTRQTRGGSAFSRGYADLHRRLAGVSASDVALAMRFIKKREIDRDWSPQPSAGDG